MKFLFVVLVIFFATLVRCDCDQLDGTTWECTGGSAQYSIQFFAFDDDEFTLYLQYDDCTIFQDGNYEVDNNDIAVDLNGVLDNCQTSDENDQCDCFSDFDMTIDSQCLNIVGPNGEACVPQGDCAMQACSNGATPIADPNYVPSTNECGPSSIPFGAPSFAFAECCNNHDLCYPVCNKEKRNCDYEFYTCMACACKEEYDTNVGEELCLILACLYFQAVDEFGCDAYESSQDNGCICPTSKGMEVRDYKKVPDKFGNFHTVNEALELYAKGTLGLADFVCDAPLKPDCPSTSASSGSPASPASTNNSPASTNNSPASPASTNNSPASPASTNNSPASPASNSNNNSTNTSNSPASNSNNSNSKSSNNSSGSTLIAGALTVLAIALI